MTRTARETPWRGSAENTMNAMIQPDNLSELPLLKHHTSDGGADRDAPADYTDLAALEDAEDDQ